MQIIITQSQYNYNISRLAVLLSEPSKLGSPADIEIAKLSREIEDFEVAFVTSKFEPYYRLC